MNTIFTQSEKWLEFQKSLGRKGWLIKNSPDGQVIGVVIKYDLPFGLSYLYCPYGPLCYSRPLRQSSSEASENGNPDLSLRNFLDEIKKIAKQESAVFLRCDPQSNLDLGKYGFKKAPADYYFSATAMPQSEAVLDINNSEERLLANMKPKTRYNIHLAEKKELIIKQSRDKNDLDIFYKLLQKTAKREKIHLHDRGHYEKLMRAFGGDIELFVAYHENQPVAGILVLFFGETTTYLHGGFDDNCRQLMAPYLLQWRAIEEAKKRGCGEYDFGGASNIENHPWAGVTRFKLGFGAKIVNYSGAFDLVFKPIWYAVYNLLRRAKNLKIKNQNLK